MKRVYAVTLMILGSSLAARPAPAQGMIGYYNNLLAAKKECNKAFDANARESRRTSAAIRRIPHEDYAALCRFGRNIGYPAFEQRATRLRTNRGCQKDGVAMDIADALEKNAEGYRNIVGQDCQKAGM